MHGSRSAAPKNARGLKESRKRQRNRAVIAVASTIAVLALLPILNAPRPTATRTSSSSSAAAATTTTTPALRADGVDSNFDHESSPGGSGGVGSGMSPPELREEGSRGQKEQEHEQGSEQGWAGEEGVLAPNQGKSEGAEIRVSREGGGGKLPGDRDRCFFDSEGYQRCYPTVFFFGTSKCGTTSLARWLDNHPTIRWVSNPRRPNQVEQTGVKEAHVFDDAPKGSRETEQESLHEKLLVTAPKTSADSVVIDYTPHYIAVAETPHRIADMYGGRNAGLKFIVTLREPASRAISSWEFKNEYNPKKGRPEESRPLAKTVMDGRQRADKLHACVTMAKTNKKTPLERDLKLCNPRQFLETPLYVSHVGKSMYAMQLERWFDLFGRENFKVVFTDEMAVDPVGVIKDVLDFLGLDFTSDDESKGLPDMKRWNKITGMAYNKTKSKKKDELGDQVTDEVTEELRSFFRPHNEDLEKLLGMPLPAAWKQ